MTAVILTIAIVHLVLAGGAVIVATAGPLHYPRADAYAKLAGIGTGSLLAIVVITAVAFGFIGCRSPAAPTAPRPPQVDRGDRGFECRPGETWGECFERECQRRARCL